ncbi:MAG: hypothetical protein JWQ42_1114 [Edaphobacter sp.]|nr:hypothetical protein [Edaphobacter sp.]
MLSTGNGKNNGNGNSWLGRGCIPTHRDETAMDGAPGIRGAPGKMRKFFAALRMTCEVVHL